MQPVPEEVDQRTPAADEAGDAIAKRRPWWREPELAVLLVLAACFYTIRVTDLSVRGEESRRGRIAWEIWQSGDWIVPRIQGQPVFFRPPLQNWLIALVGMARGGVDEWALRLPSVLGILAMVVITYGYARSFLSRCGAFFCALCLVSLGQVLELGRLGETDSLFTLFLAGSLLTWKWCQNAGTSQRRAWCLGYALAALATLTKGVQAPLYFVGSVSLFCLITHRKRQLLSRDHAVGLLTGLAVVALWQVPYTIKMGPLASMKIYFHDVSPRFFEFTVAKVVEHMVTYPLELLGGALLPWSVWLVCLLSPEFRHHLRRWREDVLYLAVCMAVAFPSVWIAPGASLRYYMSLFPCFACLVGIMVEARITLPARDGWLAFVCWYQRVLALLILSAGTGVVAMSWMRPQSDLSQSIQFAVVYCTCCVVAAGWIWWFSTVMSRRALMFSFTAAACFLGLSEATLVVNLRQRTSEDAGQVIASMKQRIPAGTRFVSLGPAHHLFLFHLQEPVRLLGRDEDDPNAWGNTDYFCMWIKGTDPPQLGFSWEPVATISCDRNRSGRATEVTIVGRRKSSATVAGQPSQPPHF
ncbi:MAG TPA: glycosyltransferase family 39 protein [Planctomycetaceae bacterium]|jgi:4-amino-4-deoxy-L-arabinose transferase-like glycosyltransferase|nr:glycosyltransferase family 39 protein [Planctomycetaceae bacterium]